MKEACDGARDRASAAVDFLDPLIERLAISRRVADAMRRIVAVLPRFAAGKTGKFARNALFDLATQIHEESSSLPTVTLAFARTDGQMRGRLLCSVRFPMRALHLFLALGFGAVWISCGGSGTDNLFSGGLPGGSGNAQGASGNVTGGSGQTGTGSSGSNIGAGGSMGASGSNGTAGSVEAGGAGGKGSGGAVGQAVEPLGGSRGHRGTGWQRRSSRLGHRRHGRSWWSSGHRCGERRVPGARRRYQAEDSLRQHQLQCGNTILLSRQLTVLRCQQHGWLQGQQRSTALRRRHRLRPQPALLRLGRPQWQWIRRGVQERMHPLHRGPPGPNPL